MAGNRGMYGFSAMDYLGMSIGGDLVEVGLDKSTTTSSTYSRVTARLAFYYGMLVQSLKWDIFANGTYAIDFLSNLTGSTSIYSVAAAFVAAGGQAEYTILPDAGAFYIPPGVHYLSIAPSPAVRIDYNVINLALVDGVAFLGSSWEGAALTQDQQGIRFVGQQVRVSGATTPTRYMS